MALHIDYYASLNSPWTHLGAQRIEDYAAKYGATLRIYPVDFGTVFANSGGLPLPRRSPQRRAYRMMELPRWRDFLGIPINLEPKYFPSDETLSSSCVIALRETAGDNIAIKLAHRVLKAVWEDEVNPGDPEVLGRMLEIVHEAGAAPTWLELELTESSMMSDPEHSVVIMEYLAAAGFGLSIDDFGTGYSSLSYLKRFSADEIKIDISFVRDMLTDPDDYAIVNTIIALAHGFGMTTTAEGVEVEGQSEALKAMGCDVAQGYLYSRAEAPDIFSEIWLAAGRMHAPASSTPPGGATAIP